VRGRVRIMNEKETTTKQRGIIKMDHNTHRQLMVEKM
jgi:hypothetical protein